MTTLSSTSTLPSHTTSSSKPYRRQPLKPPTPIPPRRPWISATVISHHVQIAETQHITSPSFTLPLSIQYSLQEEWEYIVHDSFAHFKSQMSCLECGHLVDWCGDEGVAWYLDGLREEMDRMDAWDVTEDLCEKWDKGFEAMVPLLMGRKGGACWLLEGSGEGEDAKENDGEGVHIGVELVVGKENEDENGEGGCVIEALLELEQQRGKWFTAEGFVRYGSPLWGSVVDEPLNHTSVNGEDEEFIGVGISKTEDSDFDIAEGPESVQEESPPNILTDEIGRGGGDGETLNSTEHLNNDGNSEKIRRDKDKNLSKISEPRSKKASTSSEFGTDSLEASQASDSEAEVWVGNGMEIDTWIISDPDSDVESEESGELLSYNSEANHESQENCEIEVDDFANFDQSFKSEESEEPEGVSEVDQDSKILQPDSSSDIDHDMDTNGESQQIKDEDHWRESPQQHQTGDNMEVWDDKYYDAESEDSEEESRDFENQLLQAEDEAVFGADVQMEAYNQESKDNGDGPTGPGGPLSIAVGEVMDVEGVFAAIGDGDEESCDSDYTKTEQIQAGCGFDPKGNEDEVQQDSYQQEIAGESGDEGVDDLGIPRDLAQSNNMCMQGSLDGGTQYEDIDEETYDSEEIQPVPKGYGAQFQGQRVQQGEESEESEEE